MGMIIMKTLGIIKLTCPKCGCNESRLQSVMDSSTFGECVSCGAITFENIKPANTINKPVVKCPYCGSTNTKKITSVSKVAHAVTFGLLSINKITKEWYCNKCKSNF